MLLPIIRLISRTPINYWPAQFSITNLLQVPSKRLMSSRKGTKNSDGCTTENSSENDHNRSSREDFLAFSRTYDASQEDQDNIFDREFVEMKTKDFVSLYEYDNTNTTREQIETILNEYEYYKYNSSGRVPSKITESEMRRILDETSNAHGREKMFNYLFKREMAKRAYKVRAQKDREASIERLAAKNRHITEVSGEHGRTGLLSKDGNLIYGLWHNSLFCRIPEKRFKQQASNSSLIQAALFGKKLIFDFDFEDQMSPWTCRNVLDQIQEAYGLNRYNYDEPFDFWFCNLNQNSLTGKYLTNNALTNLYNGSMITVKNDCFTKHFDTNRLVYLTPNSRISLDEDISKNDDIYIIGVYNDKGCPRPLTYRKACNLGIRARCLPLDTYLAWQGPTKSLCVNHVTGILLEVIANGGDWRQAMMKHIPSRKIKPIEVVMQEEERRKAKLMNKRKFTIRNDTDWI